MAIFGVQLFYRFLPINDVEKGKSMIALGPPLLLDNGRNFFLNAFGFMVNDSVIEPGKPIFLVIKACLYFFK